MTTSAISTNVCRAKLGFDREWIATVLRLEPNAGSCLTTEERAVQQLIVALLINRGKGVSDLFEAAIAAIGAEQAIAVLLFLTGRYVTHALVVNAMALAPPVPSIFAMEPA